MRFIVVQNCCSTSTSREKGLFSNIFVCSKVYICCCTCAKLCIIPSPLCVSILFGSQPVVVSICAKENIMSFLLTIVVVYIVCSENGGLNLVFPNFRFYENFL